MSPGRVEYQGTCPARALVEEKGYPKDERAALEYLARGRSRASVEAAMIMCGARGDGGTVTNSRDTRRAAEKALDAAEQLDLDRVLETRRTAD